MIRVSFYERDVQYKNLLGNDVMSSGKSMLRCRRSNFHRSRLFLDYPKEKALRYLHILVFIYKPTWIIFQEKWHVHVNNGEELKSSTEGASWKCFVLN